MIIWSLAKKEMRLLLRDRMAVVVLLGMPLVFILLWGLMLGENFGQKNADEKLRIYLVDLDQGDGLSPGVPWSNEVYKDLNETAGIHVEPVPSVERGGAPASASTRSPPSSSSSRVSATASTSCSFLDRRHQPLPPRRRLPRPHRRRAAAATPSSPAPRPSSIRWPRCRCCASSCRG